MRTLMATAVVVMVMVAAAIGESERADLVLDNRQLTGRVRELEGRVKELEMLAGLRPRHEQQAAGVDFADYHAILRQLPANARPSAPGGYDEHAIAQANRWLTEHVVGRTIFIRGSVRYSTLNSRGKGDTFHGYWNMTLDTQQVTVFGTVHYASVKSITLEGGQKEADVWKRYGDDAPIMITATIDDIELRKDFGQTASLRLDLGKVEIVEETEGQ